MLIFNVLLKDCMTKSIFDIMLLRCVSFKKIIVYHAKYKGPEQNIILLECTNDKTIIYFIKNNICSTNSKHPL